MGGVFGGGSKTSKTKVTPYSGEYKNQISDFYNKINQNFKTPEAAYTGDLSAPLSDTQQDVLSGFGNLVNTQALTDTIGGAYLDPSSNPYLDQYYDQAESKVMQSLGKMNDNVNSQFNTRGLYNSSARKESLQDQADQAGETLSNMATNIYGGAYNQERSNQMNAINQMGSLYGSLFGMGTTEQQTNQNALDKEYEEFLRQQGVDQNDINNMLQYFSLVKNPSQTTKESGGGGGLFGGLLGGIGSTVGGNISKGWFK